MADINAEYDDNASYEEDGSVAKCRAFITALRFLIRRTPKLVNAGASTGEVQKDLGQYRHELRDAQRWLSIHGGTGSSVKYLDFQDYRT
ncbi:MAG: hypothetical protein ACE5F1_11015 [Planctomycetota bacterium]